MDPEITLKIYDRATLKSNLEGYLASVDCGESSSDGSDLRDHIIDNLRYTHKPVNFDINLP